MDTVNTPTVPKKLRRLSAQDPGESRRRWHLVTEALKKRDMEAASDAKHLVRTCTRHCALFTDGLTLLYTPTV